MKQLLVFLIGCWTMLGISAQELTVKSMTAAPMDLSASLYERKDLNNKPCALVKVQSAAVGTQFEGNVIPPAEYKTGEYWVYMSPGSYLLNIKHPQFVPLTLNFRDYGIRSVESKVTYVLTLLKPQGVQEIQKQKLIINYTPNNAMVLIDSKPYKGNGRVEEEFPLGEHTYVIAATGYITAEGTIKLNANGPRVFNEQLMKESTVAAARSQTPPDINHHAKSAVKPPTTNTLEKQLDEVSSSAVMDSNEMTLRQMILHPLGVLPDHDGLNKEGVKSALLAVNNKWEVLENMGGEIHVHGFNKTYKGKSINVWCDFDYRMYKKLSDYFYCFYFKNKDEAQSFFDVLLNDLLLDGVQIDDQQISGNIRSAKTTYKGRALVLSMNKRNSANSKYAVKLKVSPHNMKTFTVGNVQFRMVRVEGGTFMMGSNDSGAAVEKPEHQVTLANDYYIGETEVTQPLWEAVMGFNPSSYKFAPCPVERVSWDDCQKFIQKLNEMVKDDDGFTFRLPTEAEWEFAARGGNKSGSYKYSGSDEIEAVAWYEGNSEKRIHSVGTKQANELGLFDMSGNVWEWCQDRYGSYDGSTRTDSPEEETTRVSRGGGCSSVEWSCRSLYRGSYAPSSHINGLGLRLAF